ncbi:formylglycine-generating enzyme family protein [Commensalibacter communis]|uniref:formylglycine-generating enzyme family protein n=1 Tax=Commensalibacter communis TaxID=2972786 RepID=UPI0022FF979A|nr:SUMF1/EgtB/PvdO family nonheme iron enzyme [Commensalibacter communis]CAI3936122.1 Formylglycine-generating enzyme [Commensalibacter communis]CAI3942006.1 Formylglycine-generating enzyme [Commensalibacter communis]
MKLIIYGLAIIGGLTSLPAFAADPSWTKNLIDPHPLPDDFTLPMPCGGAMVFRAIEVPSEGGVLDDIPVQMGQTSADQGYSNYIHQSPLSAPFSSSKTGVKVYYIGKYDVTRNQYDAIMNNGTCPKADQAGQKAINNVSWFDAQDFSKKWSIWLLQNAKKDLPKRDTSYGFIRLPTESEWYFAAQGGNKVSNTEFLEPTWPMPEGIEQYVMAGSELANGQVQAVGAMKPNPLGLYDMLGEVGQMMQDYYHLNRVGRLHGQTGGIVVKGGNYNFNPSDLNTALREEIPLYDANSNQPTKLATMGFRVVIAAPSLGSLQETNQAQSQFAELLQKSENISSDTHQLINNLKNQTTDATTKAGLDRIGAQLDSDARARNDAQTATMRAQIEASAALAMNIWEHQHTIQMLEQSLSTLKMLNEKQKAGITANITNHKKIMKNSVEGYLDLIRQIADASSTIDKTKQFSMVITAFKTRQLDNLAFFADQTQNLLSTPKKQWTVDYVTKQISAIPAAQARDKE